MCDLPSSHGAAVASAINSPNCIFVPTDITKTEDVERALAETKVTSDSRESLGRSSCPIERINLVGWTRQ